MTFSFLRGGSLALLVALLAGCGGGDGGGSSGPATTISGTVAVGAPLSGAGLIVRCSSGVTRNTTTAAGGGFSVSVPTSSLPCALRATPAGGGQPLHSVANGTGSTLTTNITPLTDLVTALAVNTTAGQTLAAWFANPASNLGAVASGLAAAQTTLQNALDTAGYSLPSPFDPFATPFTPAAGDIYDDLLEALATAISNSATYDDYAALLAAFVAGSLLPDAPGDDDPEAPSNIAVLTAYAGTYTVTGTATGNEGLRGSANRDHGRGTITISANGAIDFDTGISFTVGQIVAIFDRRSVEPDKRVAVNYGASDSDERIRIYFDANGTAPANIVEIIHDNGSGTTTRAAIGSDPEESEFLGSSSGTSAIIGGTRITRSDVWSFTGPPLSVGVAYLQTGNPAGDFHLNLSGFAAAQANVGQAQACNNMAAPGLAITQDSTYYAGMPSMGGNCTITVTESSATLIRGTFTGTLSNGSGGTLTVQDGEFQYVRTPFAAGSGLPQVAASFEGLTLGSINGQGNGTGDAGWRGNWIGFVPLVAAGTELSVTPSGGSALGGGSNTVRIQDFSGIQAEGREFSQAFNGDVYVGALFRIDNASASVAESWLTLGNAAVYLGLDTSNETNQFTASLGDAASTKVRAGGLVSGNQTYLLVARLRKTGGSATYNEIALWVNPAVNDAAAPLGTATRTQGTGSLYLIDRLGFRGRQFNNLLIDRIRVSDTWDGLFADPALP